MCSRSDSIHLSVCVIPCLMLFKNKLYKSKCSQDCQRDQVGSGGVRWGQVGSIGVKSGQVRSSQVKSGQVGSSRVKLIKSGQLGQVGSRGTKRDYKGLSAVSG
jgi:hypothetical protein